MYSFFLLVKKKPPSEKLHQFLSCSARSMGSALVFPHLSPLSPERREYLPSHRWVPLQMVLLVRGPIVSFFGSISVNWKRCLGSYRQISLFWCCFNRSVSAGTRRLYSRDSMEIPLAVCYPQPVLPFYRIIKRHYYWEICSKSY